MFAAYRAPQDAQQWALAHLDSPSFLLQDDPRVASDVAQILKKKKETDPKKKSILCSAVDDLAEVTLAEQRRKPTREVSGRLVGDESEHPPEPFPTTVTLHPKFQLSQMRGNRSLTPESWGN